MDFHRIRALGLIFLIGSLIGTACAVLIIGWPPQVAPSQYSYPFDATSFTVMQTVFAVRHLGETAGMLALIGLLWRSSGRLIRSGLILALIGSVLFVGMELLAISAARSTEDSDLGSAIDAGYTLPTVLFGLGLLLAGIGIARSRALPGVVGRWIVLVSGVFVFVPLLPALFAPEVVGRIALGVWLLLLAGVGLVTVRAAGARVVAPAMELA